MNSPEQQHLRYRRHRNSSVAGSKEPICVFAKLVVFIKVPYPIKHGFANNQCTRQKTRRLRSENIPIKVWMLFHAFFR